MLLVVKLCILYAGEEGVLRCYAVDDVTHDREARIRSYSELVATFDRYRDTRIIKERDTVADDFPAGGDAAELVVRCFQGTHLLQFSSSKRPRCLPTMQCTQLMPSVIA